MPETKDDKAIRLQRIFSFVDWYVDNCRHEREEEGVSDARLSFALTSDKEVFINSCQKGKDTTLNAEEIGKIIEIGEKKYKELLPKIEKAMK